MFEQLWVCHCGYSTLPAAFIYEDLGFRESIEIPFLMIVAFHPEHGVVLVDAPFGHDGPNNMGALLGALAQLLSIEFEDAWSVIPRIEQLGKRAGEVEHVLITHLHFDHTGGLKELSHANIHVHPREWNYAHALTSFGALRAGYVPGDWRAIGNRINKLDVPPELVDHPDDILECAVDVLGDGSVLAIGLSGHATGHVGYLFTLQDGQRVFFIGDASYGLGCVTEGREPGAMFRNSAHSFDEAYRTIEALRAFHEKHPEITLIGAHDPVWGERVRSGPIAIPGVAEQAAE